VRKIRDFLITTVALATLLVPQFAGVQFARAQNFPSRPVRIVVAFPPGGPTDFVGRLVADKMTSLLGQRVYIDNKPGANGTLGGGDVAKSDPDGYSLFLTTAGAVTVSPHIMANMPFDTFRDFAPVSLVRPSSASNRSRISSHSPSKSRAPSHSHRPASARRRILPS
jgi:tripartite-type tricarboxylate transporter receptor subunit TctC